MRVTVIKAVTIRTQTPIAATPPAISSDLSTFAYFMMVLFVKERKVRSHPCEKTEDSELFSRLLRTQKTDETSLKGINNLFPPHPRASLLEKCWQLSKTPNMQYRASLRMR